MKKTFTILTLIFSLLFFSQEIKLRKDKNTFSEVEQTAEFPGGIGAFINNVKSNFDGSTIQGLEGAIKVEVTIIVEKDGCVTDIKVSGKNPGFNSGVVRAVQSTKTQWTPAKINSESVRSYIRFPLTMNFE
jgi:protein TonB